MERNNDYTKANLLDYEYYSKHYKLLAIDLSKQLELENLVLKQHIIFLVGLKMIMQQCSLWLESQKKRLLNFYKML